MHRQYGAPARVGDGLARTYVVLNAKDHQAPVELGIALTAGALKDLPTGDMGMDMYMLQLPEHAPAPYTFAVLNWEPTGHPPPGIYTFPHFDFHFYTISMQEWNSIVPSNPDFAAEANNLPTDGYVPPTYVPLTAPGAPPSSAAVPMMGVHWFSVLAPEFHGEQFTKTFIYGSWNGRFTFYEPMVTLAYLQSQPNVTTPIPVPQLYAEPGYFPTSYRVSYDAQTRQYLIALSGLTHRE